MRERLKGFFWPEWSRRYVLRVVLVAVVAFVVFYFFLAPARIHGASMEPTYHDGAWMFYWRPKFWFRPVRQGDVVVVRFAGRRVMLLKRVVAVAGDTVAFEDGKLLVNGEAVEEPYVVHRSEWNLEPREVKPGHVYVVGDNRGMPMEGHRFGQVELERIEGGPW